MHVVSSSSASKSAVSPRMTKRPLLPGPPEHARTMRREPVHVGPETGTTEHVVASQVAGHMRGFPSDAMGTPSLPKASGTASGVTQSRALPGSPTQPARTQVPSGMQGAAAASTAGASRSTDASPPGVLVVGQPTRARQASAMNVFIRSSLALRVLCAREGHLHVLKSGSSSYSPHLQCLRRPRSDEAASRSRA